MAQVNTTEPQATWEDKLMRFREIVPSAQVLMRSPGSWYVCAGMQGADGIGRYGDAATPAEAVEEHWRIYTNGIPFLVSNPRQWWVYAGERWIPTIDPNV